MLYLTKQERIVFIVFVSVVLTGTVIQYAYKKNPRVYNWINLAESDTVYYKINVNTATADELIRIPYLGERTAQRIIEYRDKNNSIDTKEELKGLRGIRLENYKRFSKHLCTDHC